MCVPPRLVTPALSPPPNTSLLSQVVRTQKTPDWTNPFSLCLSTTLLCTLGSGCGPSVSSPASWLFRSEAISSAGHTDKVSTSHCQRAPSTSHCQRPPPSGSFMRKFEWGSLSPQARTLPHSRNALVLDSVVCVGLSP